MSEPEETAAQPISLPALPKPPSVTTLMLERMRLIEESITEVEAVVRVSRTYNNAEMTEIRAQGAQISRAFLYVSIALPVIAFLLGGILVAVLLR